MGRTQIGQGPAVDGCQPRPEQLNQGLRRCTPVVDPDLFRPQPARPCRAVIEPPGGTDVEDMSRALPVANGEERLATEPAGKAKLPAGLPPAAAVDSQVLVGGQT